MPSQILFERVYSLPHEFSFEVEEDEDEEEGETRRAVRVNNYLSSWRRRRSLGPFVDAPRTPAHASKNVALDNLAGTIVVVA